MTSQQISLLDRFFQEVCRYALEYASRLPIVTQASLSQVLQREDDISAQIRDIARQLAELQRSVYVGSSDTGRVQFEMDYKNLIGIKFGYMELFGTKLSSTTRNYPLDIAYINLSVQHSANHKILVQEVIEASRRVVIRGAAGSGKTTLLKWIATSIAEARFEDEYEHWNELTPFIIKLRQCIDLAQLPAPEEFIHLVAPNIADNMPKGWVHEKLRGGKAFVLVDGVDEISQREDVSKWINELVSLFPNNYYIVTSRPLARTDPWELPNGFIEAEILPMELTDINRLIIAWHNAIKISSSNFESDIDEMAANVFEVIKSNIAIQELAKTPILCAMICALHRDNNRNIPSNRLELYETCTNMLIDLRETGRNISHEHIPTLSYREKIEVLSDLAFYLLCNGWSEVERSRAKERLERSMKLIPNLRNLTTPAKLLDFFVERTGMIREPTTASIDFAHRTFQEYLSAVYAVHNDEIGMLTRLATDTQWREVIILAAGLANQKQRQELIATILLRGDEEEDNRHQLHMLAIACLETLTGIEPDLHSEIIRNLEELIPPQNLEEAKALATAGDLAVPHLRKNGRSFSRYNINALEAIKSQVSVQALFDYIEDANTELANQLLQTFNRLYQDEVGRKLLSGLRIPEWKINKPRLFPFLHHFGNVGKLTIQHYPHPDFPDITHLKDTKELILIDCPSIKSPEVFKSLTGLEKIAIINCSSFTELRGISSFRELRELELRNVPVDNLTPFGRLSELSRLSITKLNIKDLPEMLTVPLKRLEIKKCKELTGIENLRFYSEVRTLVLEECPNIFDLNGNLLKMRRLRKLDLITSDSKPIYRISEALRNKVNVVERKP